MTTNVHDSAVNVEGEIGWKHCLRCGYRWYSRVPDPKACPSCVSRLWGVAPTETPAPASEEVKS